MLSSVSKTICYSRLSLSLIKQQCSFASSSKGDSSSRSTNNTSQNNKKDIHTPKIDASHQSGTKSQQERTVWQNKEQGLASDTQTRQERIPQGEKKNPKTKTSNN
jgi:hypothetical protein